MRRPHIRAVLMALLIPSVAAHTGAAQAREDCPAPATSKVETVRIRSVDFTGSSRLLADVRDALVKALVENDHPESTWENEVEGEIREAWQEHGYHTATFHVEVRARDRAGSPHKLDLVVRINEGHQYRLKDVDIRNTDEDRPLQFSSITLRDLVPLQRNDLFSIPKIREGLMNLRRIYLREGFMDMVAMPATEVNQTDRTILLRLHIQEGQQFRVGAIRLAGHARFERYLQSQLKSGQVFNYEQFENLLRDHKFPQGTRLTPAALDLRRDLQTGTVDILLGQRHEGCPTDPPPNPTIRQSRTQPSPQ